MYTVLKVKKKNGSLVGMIQSFNRVYLVSYAQNDLMRESLQKMLDGGIDVAIPWHKEIIRINSTKEDLDFLEQAQRYLNISYEYSCTCESFEELKPEVIPRIGTAQTSNDFKVNVIYTMPVQSEVHGIRLANQSGIQISVITTRGFSVNVPPANIVSFGTFSWKTLT